MEPRLTPVEWFEQSAHLPFLRDTTRMLFQAYQDADDECRSKPREVAHDFRGHLRRALIEERWPAVAQRYVGEGVGVSYQPNAARTSYFAQITFGRVILTESYAETPETVIRRAAFRDTLARPNTRSLFGDDPPPLPTDPLYALLIHGEDAKRRHPYFADVVFPDKECREYLGRVQLFHLCWETVDSLMETTAQEEIIPDEARPQLRPQDNREA